jgi:hypothetical protein
MKAESRPSSEQGLASAVNLAGAFDHEFRSIMLCPTARNLKKRRLMPSAEFCASGRNNASFSTAMPTIKELHELYLSKLTTTLRESALLLQKDEGGLDGELKTSGWICEQFVRQTLQRFIVPGHFRITSGFIATPKLMRGQESLPQCDILIVSGNALPLLRFEETGIEVVPYESVAGIIEVKRTLTKKHTGSGSKGVFAILLRNSVSRTKSC